MLTELDIARAKKEREKLLEGAQAPGDVVMLTEGQRKILEALDRTSSGSARPVALGQMLEPGRARNSATTWATNILQWLAVRGLVTQEGGVGHITDAGRELIRQRTKSQ